ncbi:MAG: metal-dependent transcriptional regulator [Candidatus Dormibacteria bacterium]
MALDSTTQAPLSDTAQRYLETIYYIVHEGGVARPGRIAEWMGVSAPTVSVTLQRLVRDGWLEVESDRSVRLTDAGHAAASRIVRRHRILERWLVDVLGLDWATADEEAEALAQGLSDLVLERLDAHLGKPATCPHGNHIPGRGQNPAALVSLAALSEGAGATVVRVSEVAEHDAPQLLDSLHTLGLVPGAVVEVVATGDPLSVRRGDRQLAVPWAVAACVWVETSLG